MRHLRALLIGLLLGLATLGFLVFALFVVFVVFESTTIEEEMQRATSPDGTTDAVLMYEGGGGAAGWSYRSVYITPVGSKAEDGATAIRSSRLSRLPNETRLRRQSDSLLEVGTTLDPPELDIPFEHIPRVEDKRGEEYEVKLVPLE